MSIVKKYQHQLDLYARGQLSADDRYDLERRALDDPFLFDAIEGISMTGDIDYDTHIQSLIQKVNQKKEKKKRRLILWPVGVAAGLLILYYVGSVLLQPSDSPVLVDVPEIKDETSPAIVESGNQQEETAAINEGSKTDIEIAETVRPEPVKKDQSVTPLIEEKKKSKDLAINEIERKVDEPEYSLDRTDEVESPSEDLSNDSPRRTPLSNANPLKLNNAARSTLAGDSRSNTIKDTSLDALVKNYLEENKIQMDIGAQMFFEVTFDDNFSVIEVDETLGNELPSEPLKKIILTYKNWNKKAIPLSKKGIYIYTHLK